MPTLFQFPAGIAAADAVSGYSSSNAPVRDFPSVKGNNGTRQSQVPNKRPAVNTRNMLRWMLPESGVVEMFVNPSSLSISDRKKINEVRTKNGFILQYWGEELTTITGSGTTASSGVEGINVLYDIYRNEQVNMDPLALAVEAAKQAQDATNPFNGIESIVNVGLKPVGDYIMDTASNILTNSNSSPVRPRPTLASMAFTVEMYWSGWVFRGFFTDFRVEERAEKTGLFDYSFTFKATQKRGLRLNFMPWHRSAVNGPSNSSDPSMGGVPYSFSEMDPANPGTAAIYASFPQQVPPSILDSQVPFPGKFTK
jgi:hypothetical protein